MHFESLLFTVGVGLIVGAVIGFMSGLFAIGGGLIAIPLLGVVFGMDQQAAQGTSLAMVAPNVCIGVWRYSQRNAIDLRTVGVLALVATPVTMVFARIATLLPSKPLRLSFVALLVVLAIELLRRSRIAAGRVAGAVLPSTLPTWTAIVLGAVAGAVSGIFGVGGAIVTVAVLTTLYGFSQTMAQGVSLAYVAPGTILSVFIYAYAHDVNWAFALPLALGGMTTITPGVVLAHRLPEKQLQLLFASMLLVASIALVYRAIRLDS